MTLNVHSTTVSVLTVQEGSDRQGTKLYLRAGHINHPFASMLAFHPFTCSIRMPEPKLLSLVVVGMHGPVSVSSVHDDASFGVPFRLGLPSGCRTDCYSLAIAGNPLRVQPGSLSDGPFMTPKQYHSGKGEIAVCVHPIREGDHVASNMAQWAEFNKLIGVTKVGVQ